MRQINQISKMKKVKGQDQTENFQQAPDGLFDLDQ